MFFFLNLLIQGEIDARADSFKATTEAGTNLVSSEHYAANDIKEKVSNNHLSFVSY